MELCLLKIRFWEFFLDELVIDRAEFAAVDALQAADTFRAVGPLINFDIHRAILPAFVAQCAFILERDHLEETDLVEKGKDRAQRTCGPAKRPLAHNHPDDEQDQERDFPGKQESELPPNIWTYSSQRKSRFQGAGRADPFTEPCLAEAELIHDKKWKKDDKHHKDNVFHICQEFGDVEFLRFDLVQQLLEESERAEPAARHPAYQAANSAQKSYHIQSKLVLRDR